MAGNAIKHPTEVRNCAVDFASLMAAAETPSGVPVAAITRADGAAMGGGDLAAGTPSVQGTMVVFALSAGNDGVTYQVQVTTTTTASPPQTLVAQGLMLVSSKLPPAVLS